MFDANDILEFRIKSYQNIIECLQDQLCTSISVNDKEYSDELHKKIWDLRKEISNLSKQIND